MYSIIVIANSKAYDISKSVGKISWKGSATNAPRSLSFEYYGPQSIRFTGGEQILLVNPKGAKLFNGIVLEVNENIKKYTQEIVSYDPLIYAANNEDSYVFSNQRAHEIHNIICKTLGLKVGRSESAPYVIGSLVCDGTTLYDMIQKAIKTTFEQTGERFYMRYNAQNNASDFFNRRTNTTLWKFEHSKNIEEFNLGFNISDIRNQVKLVCKDGDNIITSLAKDPNSQSKFGVFQLYESINEKLNQAQLNQRATSLLASKRNGSKNINLKVMGVDSVISGEAIIVTIPHLNISKAFYVQNDNHTFIEGYHSMDLTLMETNEVSF
jgi:hypothetical protein